MENFIFCGNIQEALNKVKEECLKIQSIESCGFIGYSQSKKIYTIGVCDNKADDPKEFFFISPYDYIEFLEKSKIVCVYHSHIDSVSTASESDIKCAENSCIPYLIYSIKDDDMSLIIPKIVEGNNRIYKKGVKELERAINL